MKLPAIILILALFFWLFHEYRYPMKEVEDPTDTFIDKNDIL